MANDDDGSKALDRPTSDLAPCSPELQEEDWELCLLRASDQFSQTGAWISCSALVLLALASLGLWFVLQSVLAKEVWEVVATKCAVVVVYGGGGLIAWRIRERVGNYLDVPDAQHLEEVFQVETDYWMYCGILSFVSLTAFASLAFMLYSGSITL